MILFVNVTILFNIVLSLLLIVQSKVLSLPKNDDLRIWGTIFFLVFEIV
jgi:hypothetical protein